MDVKSTLLALLCAAAVYSAHAGQVYKWVDPNGRTHFSDTPQQGWKPVDLNESPSAATAAVEDDADVSDQDGAAEDTDTGAAGDAPASASREQLRAEECKTAKDQLASYKKAPKIVERDALGKEKEYSSDERLQLIEQTQKRVKDYCGEPTQ